MSSLSSARHATRASALALLAVFALASSATAQETAAVAEDTAVPPPPIAEAPVVPGCEARATLDVGARRYLACAHGAVVVVEGGVVVASYAVHGEPASLFERGGRVWVELLRLEAVALPGGQGGPNLSLPVPPIVTMPPAETLAEGAAGLGARPVASPAPDVEEPEESFDGPAALDPNGSYRDRMAPPRVPGWELSLFAHPFLGSGAAGLLADGSVGFRAEVPFFLRLEFDPVGYAFAEDGDFGQFHGYVMLGYDHQWFEMGIGLGAMHARIDDFPRRADGMSLTLVNSVRLGARDGMYLHVASSFVMISGSPEYGSTTVRMQMPLRPGKWLIMRGGGGGAVGAGFGELGLRILTRGDLGSGSLFITPAIGGLGVFDDIRENRAGGFTMTVGVEYRP